MALQAGLELRETVAGLTLVGDGMELRGDFAPLLRRVSPARLPHELLVRAARLKGVEAPRAIDATAGLGEDSFLLAAAGFSVRLFEHNPVVAALLADALRRARDDERLAAVARRMSLVEGDGVEGLRSLETPPDLVFLDPMFPARQKGAAVKKKLQLLQRLEIPCTDERELLRAAIGAGPRKLVVKRPLKGPALAGMRPSYSLRGKAIRYDVLVLPS